MRKPLSFLFISLLLSVCASIPSPEITISEPDRIRFHGKGAGAGMMLMSSMGPMGIAVGVAIDEGIGKDIDQAAKVAGFNIQTTLLQHLPAKHTITSITIDRYGFVLRSGKDDPAASQLHITAILKDGGKIQIKYPEEFDEKTVETCPLEKLKKYGALTVKAFDEVIPVVIGRM
ncbi:MAG: hypothetical protein K6L80_07885 [Agarilytica sp.]